MRDLQTRVDGWRARAASAAVVALLLSCAPMAVAAVPTMAASPLPPPPVTMPTDPTDVQAWLAYREARDLPALPAQATILHRMGVEAQKKGGTEVAVRLWRGAEELDPGYLAPRLALISHFISHDPSQGLMEVGRLAGLARSSFRLQHFLTSSVLFYALTAVFLATLGIALLLCWRHRNRLRHVYQELLARHLPAPRARIWGWILVALPFALGLGVAVPAVFTLALLWSYLKKSERVVFVALAAMLLASPMVTHLFDELSLPARSSEPPFYSTLELDRDGFSAQRLAGIAALAEKSPDNPFLAFAEGWLAQRGRRYEEAVTSYERAQARWPQEARIPNNLGNIEFARGNAAQAEIHYKRAIELAPRWAPAHYNLGQLHTARFRYAEASEEIAQATALDFDLVRNLQARSSGQATPALAEEWIEPRTQWQAVFDAGATDAPPVVPPAWQPWFESRGNAVAIWTLLLVAIGLAFGFLLHHHLPARVCGNCSATVCRRCATRRRDQVLCEECAALVTTATTPEFGRLLLFKRRRETRRRQGQVRTAIAVLVPGYGVIAFDRLLFGWFLVVVAVASALVLLAGSSPFPYDPRVIAQGPRPLAGIAMVSFALTYLVSLFAYLSLHGHARIEEAGIDTSSGRAPQRLKRAA